MLQLKSQNRNLQKLVPKKNNSAIPLKKFGNLINCMYQNPFGYTNIYGSKSTEDFTKNQFDSFTVMKSVTTSTNYMINTNDLNELRIELELKSLNGKLSMAESASLEQLREKFIKESFENRTPVISVASLKENNDSLELLYDLVAIK